MTTLEPLVHTIPPDLARHFSDDLRVVIGDIKPGLMLVNEDKLKDAKFLESLKASKMTLIAVPTSALPTR